MKPLLSICAAAILVSIAYGEPAPEPKKTTRTKAPVPPAAHIEANNHFAFDLYGKLRKDKPDENLFYSPTSISMALAMTSAGARGETAKQMAAVLRWDRDAAALHAGMNDWIGQLNAIDSGQAYDLRVANRLWAQQGYKFVPDFLKVTREMYLAELGQVNFQAQTEAARQTINRWVEQQTAGKIQNLIPVGRLSPQSRLVLTNAIYFKGDWQTPFKKSRTSNDDFALSAAKKVSVPMMQMTEDFQFAHVGGVKVLRLPYKGNQLSMVVVLPDESAGLSKVEESLSNDRWKEWSDAIKSREVWLRLPRFKTTSEFMLNGALSELGMPLAFDAGAADFSGMNGKQDLFIGLVVHKSYVDVNEQGTEAAAATGVLTVEAAPVRERPEEFHADHPFLFAIVDNRAGSILFLGRVLDPTK